MGSLIEVKVPDIGDFAEVEVIEILAGEGQQVAAEDSLITVESDKATMDIPAPQAGTISKLLVKVGQMVSQGTTIAMLTDGDAAGDDADAPKPVKTPQPTESETPTAAEVPAPAKPPQSAEPKQTPPQADAESLPNVPQPDGTLPHASPAIRRLARELGAQLTQIHGSGAKGRILKQDVKDWVKQQLTSSPSSGATVTSGIPPVPSIDFSQFGNIEQVPLTRIKKISGAHLQRAWLNIPHVTHHDEADITELEEFRQSLKKEAEKEGIRITLLGFVIKIVAQALKKFPTFNAALHADGESLVMKKYYNIGIAVDTPQGLVVPVIKEVDRKTIFDLAKEMHQLSTRAREGKLKPSDLQGGCMSISSLGGIGGTAFTPIVNAPEVAILGITRARTQPLWNGSEFQPRLMLPLDLSYDHRVVDGAEAARFVAFLTQSLGDARRLAL